MRWTGPIRSLRRRWSVRIRSRQDLSQANLEPGATTLVVLFHGFRKSPADMGYHRDRDRFDGICRLIVDQEAEMGRCDFLVPRLPFGLFNTVDPFELATGIRHRIDERWAGGRYEKIYFVGHSMGALYARRVYLDAMEAATGDAGSAGRWVDRVDRILLIAALNRGWSARSQQTFRRQAATRIGQLVGDLIRIVFRFRGQRCVSGLAVRAGSTFVTDLRLGWIDLVNRTGGRTPTTVVQLLGSRDDLVAPTDDVDFAQDAGFVFLDVPDSGHAEIIRVSSGGDRFERARADVVGRALTSPVDDLRADSVSPHDHLLGTRAWRNEGVSDVVFVMHGIRDFGFWTQKVARACVRELRAGGRPSVVTETSSYGFFAMLPFVANYKRREKSAWMVDQYIESRARYPEARLHYVGHSNGTYLLARALQEHQRIRFCHVVFAGSVVRRDYDWISLSEPEGGADDDRCGRSGEARVGKVLNLVATADWVVAVFPRALEQIGLGPLFDLGGAGHDGFLQAENSSNVHNVRYVKGSHSAGRTEAAWDAIAAFVATGDACAAESRLGPDGAADGDSPYAAKRDRWGGVLDLGTRRALALIVGVAGFGLLGLVLATSIGLVALAAYVGLLLIVGFRL